MTDLRQHQAHARTAAIGLGRPTLATVHGSTVIARAFTLIELLIVLAIIGLVVALGVPLFGVLTGARSVEAGRNVVAATLGQARTIAVNEGKFAGVMFYVDPATERTAMSLVIVTDPASSLEDPDPYDKYKSWVPDEEYFSGKLDGLNQITPRRADRVISFAADADATFRGQLYPQNPGPSEFLNYFGNYRPTVRSYRALQSHKAPQTSTRGQRPPQNGPYGPYVGSDPVPQHYQRPATGGGSAAPAPESSTGPFSNDRWGLNDETAVTRYSTGEQALLPRGVGVQVLIQPVQVGTGNPAPVERYVRTGVIMFDPQGRLVLREFSLDSSDPLGEYIQLEAGSVARRIVSGIGLAVYDTPTFKSGGFTEADTLYSGLAAYRISAPTNPAFNDLTTGNDQAEEQWLDANATPLIINRFTGSLSEAE